MFTILTKPNCPHCVSAKQALTFKKLEYEEVIYDTETMIEEFKSKGFRTFPQIFLDGSHIGGNDQLQMFLIDQY